jgi:TRAP-type uncharacterized transport system fused permease subunit
MKLGIVGLVVPYLFVYDMSYFLIGPLYKIVPTLVFAFTGVYALAASVQGYMFTMLSPLSRIILFGIAAALLWPDVLYPSLSGLAAFVVYYLVQRASFRKSLRPTDIDVG